MAYLSTAQANLAAAQTVFFPRLLDIALTAGTMRLWLDGLGSLTVDGFTYTGTGEVVSVGELELSEGDAATKTDFVVSGVDPDFIALAKDSEDLRGVEVTLWGAFLNEALQPVESRLFLARRYLDVATYHGQGPVSRGMTIPGETIWTARNDAAYAFFSDRDQQLRFPGDRGLDRIVLYTGDFRVIWPVL